jgi:hypothetical protein
MDVQPSASYSTFIIYDSWIEGDASSNGRYAMSFVVVIALVGLYAYETH